MSAANQQQKSRNPLENYITVAERIVKFYEQFENGRIITSILEHDSERGFILMRADVYRNIDDAQPASTGHAYEIQGDGPVNRNNYIENCETGCVGRALALCGFEVKRGIASREEMEKVDRMKAAPLQAVKNDLPAIVVTRVGGDSWVCGDAMKKQILDLESNAEEFGLYKKMRDALEVSTGSRNPAQASVEKAEGYINYMKAQIEKAKSDRNL